MAADNLALARTAKATLEYTADDVASTVTALYRQIVGEAITAEAIGEFILVALPVVRTGHISGASLSKSLHRQMRRAEGIAGRAPAMPTEAFNAEQAESSLRYMGLVRPAQKEQVGYDVPFLISEPDVTADLVGQSAARRVVESGMDTAQAAARADRLAIGWARVTQGADACYFCSMLESRGTVYERESFAASDPRFRDNAMPPAVLSGELAAKVHDHCRCVLVPIFSTGSTVQRNADGLYDTWKKVQSDWAWLARRAGLGMIDIWRLYWEDRLEGYSRKYLV